MRTGMLRMLMISSMILVLVGCGDTSSQVQSNTETLEESPLQHDLQLLINYDVEEIEAQIQGLKDNGVDEFLLWGASNQYTRDVDYDLE